MELPPTFMEREDLERLCRETNIIISMSVSARALMFRIHSQTADTAHSVNDVLSVHKEIVSASIP